MHYRHQWASAPVYVMTDTPLSTGAVGGSLASVEAFGKRAGELARTAENLIHLADRSMKEEWPCKQNIF
jgi:hypothetical protein